jgi:hypothetical protein
VSPEAAQGRNSPREAKPAGYAGAVPLLAETATEQEAMPLLAVQPGTPRPRRVRGPNPGTMHAAILQMKAARTKAQDHGEVFTSWQIRALSATPEMPPSSQLLVRRRQSRMLRGQMPMSGMSVNTKEAWLEAREEDTAAGIEERLVYEEEVIEKKEYPERFETVALRPSQRAAKRWTITTPMREAKLRERNTREFRAWAKNEGYDMRWWYPEEVSLSGTTDGCP